MAADEEEALEAAEKIGYPLMIRPSFVLGGRGMEVIYDRDMLLEYVAKAVGVTPDRPLLIDRFLRNALECEADALSDGKDVFIPAVMEHIELAGVHSGDSACVIPPVSLDEKTLKTIQEYTEKIARTLKVCGLMNIQYAVEDGKVYVLEANPRASRTVPLVSKVCNTQMAQLATRLMLGESLKSLNLKAKIIPHYGAKEAIFPFDKFPNVDPVLGPEMRSTGEVLGLSDQFGSAFCKSQEAVGMKLPEPKAGARILISLSEKTSQAAEALSIAKAFSDLGFQILATEGTADFLRAGGIDCQTVAKINEGRPNVVDLIVNREVCLAINTPSARRNAIVDEEVIRKAALKYRVPYITTLAGARAAARGIASGMNRSDAVRSLQMYHAAIQE